MPPKTDPNDGGPYGEFADKRDIIRVATFLIVLTFVFVFLLFAFWPPPHDSKDYGQISKVNIYFGNIDVLNEVRFLVLITLAGGIGAMIYNLRSFATYVGHRRLKRSWLFKYLFSPLVGISLAIILYIFVSAGFFSSSQPSVRPENPFALLAMGALAGLFSDAVIERLSDAANALLGRKPAEQKENYEKK